MKVILLIIYAIFDIRETSSASGMIEENFVRASTIPGTSNRKGSLILYFFKCIH